jgi:hypothetical protein
MYEQHGVIDGTAVSCPNCHAAFEAHHCEAFSSSLPFKRRALNQFEYPDGTVQVTMHKCLDCSTSYIVAHSDDESQEIVEEIEPLSKSVDELSTVDVPAELA